MPTKKMLSQASDKTPAVSKTASASTKTSLSFVYCAVRELLMAKKTFILYW